MSKTKISYDASFEELQEIMQDLQEDEISVDDLTAKVKRAAELLKMCNQILRDTEKNVGDLIKDLGM
tara:strand:- start:237 stop:437 length:201 start_codon:yes stop_codon:yes gene_type:complete